MKILRETDALALQNLTAVFADLKATVLRAVREIQPIHEMEKTLWVEVLRLGRQALSQVVGLLGNGDMGETVQLPNGRCCQRLEEEHRRRYLSVFGEFLLSRVVYGSRQGQTPETEGEVVVASADPKGIVMRRSADDPPAKAHRTKGDKASQKRMATVATVYSVDR